MTQEEKAKRYDEALGKARRYYDEYKTRDNILYVEDMEDMFPELKESEDERIRKWIIGVLSTYEHDRDLRNAAIAYLEKQGEQNSVNIDLDELVIQLEETIGTSPHSRETIKDFFQMAIQKYMNCLRIANGEIGRLIEENYWLKEKQGEQKPTDKVEPKFKVGDKIQYLKGCGTIMTIEKIENGEYIFSNNMGHTTIENGNKWYLVNRVEQNTAWSEEDEKILNYLLWFYDTRFRWNDTCGDDIKFGDIVNFLKSLKDRVQPQKQEWSDVDKDILFHIIDDLKFLRDDISKDTKYAVNIVDVEREINWLKSLRPQNIWRPSDEQMKALEWQVNNTSEDSWQYEESKNLLEQLKKLKG